MRTISVEELTRHRARLIEEIESGEVAVVTKDGRPLFLAVPYDERLAKEDVHVVVAVHHYDKELVSVGRAARIARLPLSEFIDRLATLKIPVVRYSSDELSREIAEFGLGRGGSKPVDRA
jgi:predicted HTH domain antitoxin